MTMTLHPRGALRTRFEASEADTMFRRLGLGARRCDLGDEGLYLAEEIVAACPKAELRAVDGLGHRNILFAPPVIRAALSYLTGS